MAGIPTYDNLRTQVSGTQAGGFQSPGGPNAGEIAAKQTGDLGAAVQKAGDLGSRIALEAQQQVNQVRVLDAVNQARIAAQDLAYNPTDGYLSLKNENALQRPDGKSLQDEYGSKLQEQLAKISSGLGNVEQQRQFSVHAGDLSAQFHGQVEQHMMGEFASYRDKTYDAAADIAANSATTNWRNDDALWGGKDADGNRVGGAIDAVKGAVMAKARANGLQGNVAEAAMLAAVSKAYSGAINAALADNNPARAFAIMETARKRGELTGEDILKLQGHVNQNMALVMSTTAVQSATTAAMPKVMPTPFDRMTQITLAAESGGKRYGPDGKTLLTSSAGAQGEMQVMPKTAKDPGLGVRPAQNDSPDELARVGRDYLQALVQRYGDPAKAWAAYHAGFGDVDKAIARAKADTARRGQPEGNAWLMELGPKTQAYVISNMKALSSGGGVQDKPTELDFVNDALGRLPPGAPPLVVKATRDAAIQQFGVIGKTMNEQGDNALAAVQRFLWDNKGATLAQVPPELMDKLLQYAPEKAGRNLEAYSKSIQRGDTVTDPVLYNRLTAHPEEMAKMTDPQFEMLRAALSPSAFQHFSKLRADTINGKVDESAGSVNVSALKASLNPRLSGLGINTAPNPKDTAAQERVAGIREFVRQSLFDAQRQAGKKFTPDEVEKHIDGLFTKSVEFKGALWGTNTENLMGMQFKDLPSNAAEGLKQALIKSGNKAPTNNDILNLYRKIHAAK